jgi:phosphatidylserine decarboxylase
MRIAREGVPFVIGGLVVLAAFALLARWLAAPGWVALPLAWLPIAVWIPFFFRDPARTGPRDERLVLAPADGRVVSVIEVQEPDVIQGPALQIAIFMNVLNVHVNRHPVDGTVVLRAYRPGNFFNASLDKASADNEQMSLGIASARGPVLVRQIAGLIARRIVTDPTVGERVQQGARLGLIRFGSRVETLLPPGAVARVAIGERTRAGVTVIAAWP